MKKKYFILYNDMEILHKYLRDHDISANDACVCSQPDTLNFIGVEEELINADIRLIMPDFLDNRQCVLIADKVIKIMSKNNMKTEAFVAYFRKHNLY